LIGIDILMRNYYENDGLETGFKKDNDDLESGFKKKTLGGSLKRLIK
jgi:hypothetical protein